MYLFKRLKITCIINNCLLSFYKHLFIHLKVLACRYMFNHKIKVKNKAHIKTSIYETYIIEEILIFTSYYFEPHLRTKINHVLSHDNGGELPSNENL